MHECCHLLGDHAARADAFGVKIEEARTWNVAADASINDDLRDAGCTAVAKDGVLPGYFGLEDDQTAELYMRHLADRMPKQPQGDGGGSDGGSSDENSGGGALAGCGSGSGGAPEPCEVDSPEASGTVEAGVSGAEAERARIATAAHIRQQAGKNPGSVPGGLVDMAGTILAPPKVPWRQVLAAYVRRYVAVTAGNTDTTYMRRRRRLPSLSLSSGVRVSLASYRPSCPWPSCGTPRGRWARANWRRPCPRSRALPAKPASRARTWSCWTPTPKWRRNGATAGPPASPTSTAGAARTWALGSRRQHSCAPVPRL